MDLAQLTAHILEYGQPALATEQLAAEAIAAFRWPKGVQCPTCAGPSIVDKARIRCGFGHDHSVFHGTALGRKRRLSVRAIVIALREMTTSWRSISARELARNLAINHVTLWRHLHVLRALLMGATAVTTSIAPGTQVCGRKTRVPKAFVTAGTGAVAGRSLAPPEAPASLAPIRIAAESMRTWLSGTFRGVSARWLPRYVAEHNARQRPPFASVAYVFVHMRFKLSARLD